MFPLKDDIPTRTTPVITVALIVLNVLVFLYQISLQGDGSPDALRASRDFILEFGLVPCRLTGACAPGSGLLPATVTVLTSMFLHGGLLHVGGNMLYLWIFGNNVEDAMTKGRFVVFYMLSGVVAALAQYLGHPGSPVPMVGASGAVSGALGAYLILHPHAHVWTLVGFGWFWRLVPVPAVIVLGFWIVVQLLNTVLTFGSGEPGGVAWLAHVGGFVAGMALVNVFRQRPRASYGRR